MLSPQSVQSLRTRKLKPFVIFIKAPSVEQLRETRGDARIISSYSINRAFTVRTHTVPSAHGQSGAALSLSPASSLLQDDDFVELEEMSRLMEAKYRQFFDRVLVNDDLQDACMQLCSIIQEAQDEPQWTPVSWSRIRD